jgi:lipid-A-disaccharide synthase
VLSGQTYELVHHSHASLVTSGTATLETALLGSPQIVLYKMAGGKTGYRLFRFLFLKVKFVSLPNLILDREAVREFVMDRMKYENILPEAGRLLKDAEYRKRISEMYELMKAKLGPKGAASRAAEQMTGILFKKH